jgi:hypothetical protein
MHPKQLTVDTMMLLYSASGEIFRDSMVSIQGSHFPRSLSYTKSYTCATHVQALPVIVTHVQALPVSATHVQALPVSATHVQALPVSATHVQALMVSAVTMHKKNYACRQNHSPH